MRIFLLAQLRGWLCHLHRRADTVDVDAVLEGGIPERGQPLHHQIGRGLPDHLGNLGGRRARRKIQHRRQPVAHNLYALETEVCDNTNDILVGHLLRLELRTIEERDDAGAQAAFVPRGLF